MSLLPPLLFLPLCLSPLGEIFGVVAQNEKKLQVAKGGGGGGGGEKGKRTNLVSPYTCSVSISSAVPFGCQEVRNRSHSSVAANKGPTHPTQKKKKDGMNSIAIEHLLVVPITCVLWDAAIVWAASASISARKFLDSS